MPNHLIIVSDQPMPNLIPIISMKPAKVFMLVSEQMRAKAERIKRFLSENDIEAEEYIIEPYQMDEVESLTLSILDREPPDSIALNATGGTKISAFGAFAAFRKRGFPIFYFEPKRWEIISLDEVKKDAVKPAAQISVKDYLALHGMKVFEEAADDEEVNSRREITSYLAEHLHESGLMPVLNSFAFKAQEKRTFPITISFEANKYYPQFNPILKKLTEAQIIRFDPNNKSITFPNLQSARYLNGFWLEEYVYSVIKDLGVYDVRRNVNVSWEGSLIKNEFDVVFTNNSRLFIVSCKTAKLAKAKDFKDKNPVYELDSLKDYAAGLFGIGVLVSASPLGTELQRRADTLKLVTMASKDMKKWLKAKLQIEIKR